VDDRDRGRRNLGRRVRHRGRRGLGNPQRPDPRQVRRRVQLGPAGRLRRHAVHNRGPVTQPATAAQRQEPGRAHAATVGPPSICGWTNASTAGDDTQIGPICAIVPRKNSIPAAAHIGGSASGYQEFFAR
jgi:hypothetical protein